MPDTPEKKSERRDALVDTLVSTWMGKALVLMGIAIILAKITFGLRFMVDWLGFVGGAVHEGGLRELWADNFALFDRYEASEGGGKHKDYLWVSIFGDLGEILCLVALPVVIWMSHRKMERRAKSNTSLRE